MEPRIAHLEDLVSGLCDEVVTLRGRLHRLAHEVRGSEAAESEAEPSQTGRGEPRRPASVGSYSVIEEEEDEGSVGYFGSSPTPSARSGTLTPAPSSTGGGARLPQSWAEREQICDGIAAFLVRALRGENRGTSGRERLVLASRIWLVEDRSIDGEEFRPLRVFRTFGACKALVKRGHICGDSVFVGLPSEREARRVAAISGLGWPEEVTG